MPRKTFHDLKTTAESLYQHLYGLDRDHAVIEILRVFVSIIEDTNRDVMDAVENKLLHGDHH